MPLLPVTDPDDPRIAAFRHVRERDLVGREGLTRSRHRPLAVLIDDKRLAKLAPLIGALPPGVPVYGASQEVIDAIAGFHLHRGILALGERAPDESAEALL
jgi:tRNA G18 (ribose-2'-O)-methylase SpoU